MTKIRESNMEVYQEIVDLKAQHPHISHARLGRMVGLSGQRVGQIIKTVADTIPANHHVDTGWLTEDRDLPPSDKQCVLVFGRKNNLMRAFANYVKAEGMWHIFPRGFAEKADAKMWLVLPELP
ncbi:hypothetical protein GD1_227 [Paraglaciecola Antarctic GD virus 1]|nr:hypothetical protein GD1_227 [Paraglaciecola Antarctic GD virus 1]